MLAGSRGETEPAGCPEVRPPPPKEPNKPSLGQVLRIVGELNAWLWVLFSSFGGV